MKNERLRIDNIKKGMHLKQVELQIFDGEIMYCIFDNIQEKHLFLKIISGWERADYGKVYYQESEIPEQQVPGVLESIISVVSIESNLIHTVTIGENLFLMRHVVKKHWVKNREYKQAAARLFQQFGIMVDLDKQVNQLTDFEKIQVEIMKAYLLDKSIIILTDLSNCLSSIERKKLWLLIGRLKRRGISCMVIEPLEDINFEYLDTVVVVKHGKTFFTKPAKDCDYVTLHMILYQDEMKKRAQGFKFSAGENSDRQKVEIKNLCTKHLHHISLCIPKGQIVKLLCVDEPSYEEVVSVIRGTVSVSEGSISMNGLSRNIGRSLEGAENNIGIVEGNPVTASLFTELSVMDNLKMLLSTKMPGMWMVAKYKRSIKLLLNDIIAEECYDKQIKELSPEAVQKVVYCKWLLYSPKMLVCIQPFADGDIKARETARDMLYMLEARNIPILIITSNTVEFNYCHGKDVYIRHGRTVEKEEAYRFLEMEI